MSDYNPDPRRPDPYGTTPRHEYTEVTTGRSTYAVVALLAIVAVVGGVLMFSGPQQPTDPQAQVPATPAPAPTTAPTLAPTPAPAEAPTRLPAAPPEGPIQTPPDAVTPTNPQR